MQDELGMSDEHYDVMMSKAAELCRLKNAAEKRTKIQEKQQLLERLRQIQELLDNCEILHSQGLLSMSCLKIVQKELNISLRVVQEQVANIQQRIDNLEGTVNVEQDKEALTLVLNIVADGCSRQRHSSHGLSRRFTTQ